MTALGAGKETTGQVHQKMGQRRYTGAESDQCPTHPTAHRYIVTKCINDAALWLNKYAQVKWLSASEGCVNEVHLW